MQNSNPRYRGLISTKKPSDAIQGQQTIKTGITFYPQTLDRMEDLKEVTGIDGRSQLIRAAIDFANANKEAFKESAGVKVG